MPTPLVYAPPPDRFLMRDAARFSRAFQAMGVDCKKLVIGDPEQHPVAAPELRLAPWKCWIDPEWWKREACDLVMIYGHISPRILPVLLAIKESGSTLAFKMDSSLGAPGIWLRPSIAIHTLYWFMRDCGSSRLASTIKIAGYSLMEATPFRRSARLLPVFDLADLVTFETPETVEWFKKWYEKAGRGSQLTKAVTLGHPVETSFKYTNASPAKLKQIVTVGRWKSFQKDASLLAETLGVTLARHPDYTVVIVGPESEHVRRMIFKKHADVTPRICCHSNIPNTQVRDEMFRSQIYLNSSRFEGFPIACAEALCCGCSLVAPPEVCAAGYLVSKNSGTVAHKRTLMAMAEALSDEIAMWSNNCRNPVQISDDWTPILHVDRLCKTLADFTGFTLVDRIAKA